MTADERNHDIVLVGNGNPTLQTWTWNGSSWNAQPPSTSLPNGGAIGMAFDPDVGRVAEVEYYQPGVCMPHSGCNQPGENRVATWNGTAWERSEDTDVPRFVTDEFGGPQTLTFDAARGGLLLIDGDGTTWRRVQTRWSQVANAGASPHRTQLSIAADPAHHQVVAFGGSPRLNISSGKAVFNGTNDTWLWNGTSWQRRAAPVAPTPPPAPPAPAICVLNGPALVPSQQPTNTSSVRVIASDLFTGAPCHLTASLHLLLVDGNGQALSIPGNDQTTSIDTDVTDGAAAVLSGGWTWTNACAPPGGVQAQIQATGQGVFPTPISIDVQAPTCTTGAESSVIADRLTAAASS